MRLFIWLFRALIFFTLFAFALNNQHAGEVNWFFGVQWNAPMVIIVLVAFAGGAATGILAMLPSWWRHRRLTQHGPGARTAESTRVAPNSQLPSGFGLEHPPREGP